MIQLQIYILNKTINVANGQVSMLSLSIRFIQPQSSITCLMMRINNKAND